jgi:hypothetical protein
MPSFLQAVALASGVWGSAKQSKQKQTPQGKRNAHLTVLMQALLAHLRQLQFAAAASMC